MPTVLTLDLIEDLETTSLVVSESCKEGLAQFGTTIPSELSYNVPLSCIAIAIDIGLNKMHPVRYVNCFIGGVIKG